MVRRSPTERGSNAKIESVDRAPDAGLGGRQRAQDLGMQLDVAPAEGAVDRGVVGGLRDVAAALPGEGGQREHQQGGEQELHGDDPSTRGSHGPENPRGGC